jgi:hypothetical protein
MSDERKGGLALIFANAAGILTMTLHPVPQQMGDPHARILNVAVHALAMLAAPVALVGGIALARRTGSLSAVVFQAFALVAAVLAAAMSGLVISSLLQQSAPRELLMMGGALNQAFSRMFAVATSVALVLWSVSGWRGHSLPRALAIYGVACGLVSALFVFSGAPLDVHRFGALVLAQSIFFVWAGTTLLLTTPDRA